MAKNKKQKVIISSTTDVDIKDVVTEEIEKAVRVVVEESSKKYMRDIDVSLLVNIR